MDLVGRIKKYTAEYVAKLGNSADMLTRVLAEDPERVSILTDLTLRRFGA